MLLKDTCTKMVSHLVDVDDRSEAAWLTQITTQNNSKNLYAYIVVLLTMVMCNLKEADKL